MNVQKKNISELVKITKNEITDPDTFVAITSVVHDSADETVEKLFHELKLKGISNISNPVIFKEAFPKDFQTIPLPDYKKWGWDDDMYREFVPLPFLVAVFDRQPSLDSTDVDGTQLKNSTVFLFERHGENAANDLKWFKSIIDSHLAFEDRNLLPVGKNDLDKTENESGTAYEMRIYTMMLDLGLRPSSVGAWYVASRQYSVDDPNSLKSYREHTPETPVLSQLIDANKISQNSVYASKKTIGWYDFAVHLDPKNFNAWNTLGFIYKDIGNDEKSENCFRQCIRHNFGLAAAYRGLSHLLTSQGFYKKALQVIADGLGHHEDSDLHNSKALCLLELGNYDESILESRKSLDLIVHDPCFDIHVSNSFFMFTVTVAVGAMLASNRISEIISVYEPILTMYPDSAVSFNNFGYYLELDGQDDRAKEFYLKCLDIESDHWSALLGLGMINHRQKNFVDSSAYFEKSLKGCPKNIQNDIKDQRIDSLDKYMKEQMMKSHSTIVSELGGASITGDIETDVKKIVNLLGRCNGNVLWVDPYFSRGGFTWIEESCILPTHISQVRILTTRKREEEITKLPFRKRFDRTKKELQKNNISLSLRVVENEEHVRKIHASCIISENASWEIPRVNNIQNGSKDMISPSDRDASEFDAEWDGALDFEKDRERI